MDLSMIENENVRLHCQFIINNKSLTLEEKRDIGVIISSYVLYEKLNEVLATSDIPSDL